MKRLRIVLAFVILVAGLAMPGLARAPLAPSPPGDAYGAYGCCCPGTAWLGLCPLTPGAFQRALVEYFGLTPRESAQIMQSNMDLLCGHDWDRWLPAP